MKEAIKVIDRGEVALVEFDLPGEKVNKLNTPVMERFKEVIKQLQTSDFKAAVLISRKPGIFIAGADIEEIQNLKTKEQFMPALTQAHEIFNSLQDLKIPTVAAIHGACLGGGLELVMACDYRVCSSDKKTRLGLPEVQLGIIPGFGGCVRLPRIVGLPVSLDIILAGKSVIAKKAKKIGLVDKLSSPAELEADAIQFAKELIEKGTTKRLKKYKARSVMDKFLHSPLGRPVVFKQAYKQIMKNTKGFYPAPLKALQVIKKTYGSSNCTRSLLVEAQGFCDVAITDISKYLIQLFFMTEAIKKKSGVANPDVKPLPVNGIGVLGAGVMGGGIAYVAADKGIQARMKDISNDAILKGFKAAFDLWKKKLKKRRLTQFDYEAKISHVSGTLDYSGFDKLDLVVEAIVEDMNIKKSVIVETAKHCKEDCIMVTNTSSLSVNEMAEAYPKAENFAGMHFFNPVDKMPLVEVIRGEKTSDVATATVFDLAKKMGKIPVVVKDGPGFLVNRLLFPLLSEALFLLEDGAEIKQIDRYYTNQFGMPMGPFRLMDEVGLDVCVKALTIFKKALGERIEVSELMSKLGGSGRLGRKNKKGFYTYDAAGKKHIDVDETVYADLGLPMPKANMTSKEAIERGMFQMINEAARALKEDHIVETAEEVDLAMIMGTGFPPFRGGLLKYADSLGAEYIVQQLEEYQARLGIRFKPAKSLAKMANNNTTYY